MKISEVLKQKKSGVSFEFFPHKTPKGKEQLHSAVKQLENYNPLYMSMTYGAGGTSQDRTKEAVDMLLEEKICPIMPHLTCIGATKSSIEALLNDYKIRGVENIMALRGDIPQNMPDFNIRKGEFSCGKDIVSFIKKKSGFCVGAAVYPETHIESPCFEDDLKHTKEKIDAGADFAVTQMFFDNRFYYEFIRSAQKKGIAVPILPGILPVTDLNKLKQFVSTCRVSIPKELENRMAKHLDNPQEMEKIGLDWTIDQCRDLNHNGIKFLHFFTLNKGPVIAKILDALK
jgi:methylenetetrahydrofolate reductase (NADPH)